MASELDFGRAHGIVTRDERVGEVGRDVPLEIALDGALRWRFAFDRDLDSRVVVVTTIPVRVASVFVRAFAAGAVVSGIVEMGVAPVVM